MRTAIINLNNRAEATQDKGLIELANQYSDKFFSILETIYNEA